MSNYATLLTQAGNNSPGGGVAIIRFNGVDYAPNQAGVVVFDYTQIQADWLATEGPAAILNKPTIPAAQVQSDWNATSGVASILNKPDLAPLATAVQTGQSVGSSGYNIYAGKTGTTLNFKLLQAGNNITMAQDGETITIHALFPEYVQQPSDWNATTGPTRILNKPSLNLMNSALQGAENVGTGQGLFKAIVDKVLQFRGIRAGNNVTITLDGDDLVLSSAGGGTGPSGEANTSSSAGAGASIVLPKNGVDLPFRSFLAGVGMEWILGTDTITSKLHKILEGLANLGSTANNQIIYATGDGVFNTTTLSVYGRSLIASADAPAARTVLGLGTAAVRNVGSGNLDLVENQALGTAARLAATDVVKVGDFGVGRAIATEEPNANLITAEGMYLQTGNAALVNWPEGVTSRPFLRVVNRFGYIVQEVWDTQGLNLYAYRGASGSLAGVGWTIPLRPSRVQTGPFVGLGDTSKLAIVGSGGFGGPPLFMGDPVLADYIGSQNLYGNTHVKRVDGTAAGMYSYSPILHMGGSDTWWELQVAYSTGDVIIGYGYTNTRFGVLQILTNAMKAGDSHATGGENNTLYMTPATTRAALNSPVINVTSSRSLNAQDVQAYVRVTASPISLTVPTAATVPQAVGSEINIRNAAASGNTTLVAASGVTINAPAGGSLILGPRMTACLKKVGTNEWDLIGQTVSA